MFVTPENRLILGGKLQFMGGGSERMRASGGKPLKRLERNFQ